MKKGRIIVLTLFLGCSGAELYINDTNGQKHYYGRKPNSSGEYFCFYHERLEKVEVR
jgi:hypothetical protein